MAQIQTVRNPPPRMLQMVETLHSLNHWKTSFRTYYRRDSYFKAFLLPQATWSNSARTNYNQVADMNGTNVVRTAADKGEDLRDFLNTLAGYLPFPYLTEKIVDGSTNLQQVWDTIYDHYGVSVTSETLLDYATLKLNSGETYRQFFDRLLAHARLHLPKANVTVDGIHTGDTGETMTVALMNFIALDWLYKINPQLIAIVKTDYSRELRDNTQLSELVPRIANNVDAMLSRHDIIGGVDRMSVISEETVDTINRVSYNKNKLKKDRAFITTRNRNKPFCPECHLLSKKLALNIEFKHNPAECPRPKGTVNLLVADEEQIVSGPEEDYDYTGKINPNSHHILNVCSQTKINDNQKMREVPYCQPTKNILYYPPETPEKMYDLDLCNKIFSLEMKQLYIRKEYSPQLRSKIGNVIADCIIDEGSELNCICSSVVAKCKIKYRPIKLKAMSAGSHIMKLLGVVSDDVILDICESKSPAKLILRQAVVVENLGPNVLIGEPGKMDNGIITFPQEKLIQIVNTAGHSIKLPYRSHSSTPSKYYQAHSVKHSTIVYPQEEFDIPVPPSMQCNSVNVTMRKGFEMSSPKIDNAKKTYVTIKNDSDEIIFMPKHSHVADLRVCSQIELTSDTKKDLQNIFKIYDISEEDISHLTPSAVVKDDNMSYIDQISIDPDDQLPSVWKTRFRNLCESFSAIITPRPGKYNGAYGRVSTDINFVSKPPSNLRTYLPKYSNDMLKILGDKMDTLEAWGVLRKPEELGIIPEFVVPSMLAPKPEKNQFRVVTDFTALNKYIKKLPTISPSIQEAKDKIAKYKYHVMLDLSNYYYQGGIKLKDSQYLATVHPFRGLMVYTVEPQGLLNSGEHAYERLARVYGDMCAQEQMTRMADGLYVLGNSLSDLFENLHEVFKRAETCNLTFKPSKMSICPRDIILFGWKKKGDAWTPTEHTTLPLISAPLPTTVKQLRSWIGSFKQLSSCIQNYSVPLARLEQLTGSDKSSAMKISWTEDLKTDFSTAKDMIKTLEAVYTPTPDDTLQTYSDFSAENAAVGGRLIITRMVNGKRTKLNGGFFSARLNKFQAKWLPCEGESLACKLVLEHFAHYIRENNSTVIHYTDSLPCVQAFKRARLGAFSASARIATFLTAISSLNIEIVHTAGKNIELVDYISRHPNECYQKRCQICKFVQEQVAIGDNTPRLNSIQIQDVISGDLPSPFLQRKTWIDAQKRDKTHIMLRQLITNSQAPDKKKTKHENTKLKLLYNLYREGRLVIHKDELITIKNIDSEGNHHIAVSIPTVLYPGLMHALHYKLNHPSKMQLTKLANRHFYTPGYQRIIEEVSDSCETCAALKILPRELFSESTGQIDGFGTHFSADVIERNRQKILIVREKLSSFTLTKFIEDQKAETLKRALITLILDMIPQSGTTVQVDCATAWTSLANKSTTTDSDLKRLGITIDLGRHHNKNKNPVIDNACKEFQKEILRLKPENSELTDTDRAIVTRNMNQRIRQSGLSSKEICYRRDLITNMEKKIEDSTIADNIIKRRTKNHHKYSKSRNNIEIGHNVFLKQDKTKSKARELYKVVDLFEENGEPWAIIQKHDSQFRLKKYNVKIDEIFLLPGQLKQKSLSQKLESPQCNATENPMIEEEVRDTGTNTTVKPIHGKRPQRKAAIKAKQLLVGLNLVKPNRPNQLPTHGWDYNRMMELFEHDDHETIYFQQYQEEPLIDIELPDVNVLSQPDLHSDTSTLSASPTSTGSTEIDSETDSQMTPIPSLTYSNSVPPQLPPKFPKNLLQPQDLSRQLSLPAVVQATQIEDVLNDVRQFNRRHPTPPQPLTRQLRRRSNNPSNYAAYHNTGQK